MKGYKPEGYNSVSPYLISDNAQKLVDLLKSIFSAKELRRFDRDNGKIAHIELQLDDTVIMISDSVEGYAATKIMLHVYVTDVFKIFNIAIENGCKVIEKPSNRLGDPDIRGSFFDFNGNHWSVSTQQILYKNDKIEI